MATNTISKSSEPRFSFSLGGASNWIFLLPGLFFFVGWQLYPIARVFVLSFTNYKYLTNEPADFVWFENYANAASDPLVHTGIERALLFTVAFVPGIIFLPLFLAIILDRVKSPRLATFYRLVLLIPSAIPAALIMILWTWLFNFQIGPINSTLVKLGIFDLYTAPQWLGGTNLTIPAMVIIEVWWGLGYHTMFFLAGLAMIPKELTEAARIDGANEWQLFRRVTMPRLYPILSILVVLRFGTAMAIIEEYLIFGGFNRGSPTYTWTVYMWDLAFKTGNWLQGYAAAVGWVGSIFMLVIVVGLLYIFRSRD